MTGSTRKPAGVPAPGPPVADERDSAPRSTDPSSPATSDPAWDSLDYFDRLMPRAEYMRKTPPVWGVSAPPTRATPPSPAPVGDDADGGAPRWLVVMMIASAAACTTIAGYYLFLAPTREPPARGAEPASIGDAAAPAAPPSASQPAPPTSVPPIQASPRPAPRAQPRAPSASPAVAPSATAPTPHAPSATMPSRRLFGTEE